jgi:hypothetical protein
MTSFTTKKANTPYFILFMFITCSFLSPSIFAESKKDTSSKWLSDWEVVGDDARISAECRQHKSKINQCKFIATSDHSLESLAAVIMDVNKFTEWAVSVSKSERVFQEEEPEKVYVYTNYDFVGAYDRDAVTLYTPEYDKTINRVRITFQTVDKDVPKEDLRLVRFPLMAGYWQFTKLENGKTEIELLSFTMPGGVVQKTLYYLYNIAYVDASFETIAALEKQALKPQYQQFNVAALNLKRLP